VQPLNRASVTRRPDFVVQSNPQRLSAIARVNAPLPDASRTAIRVGKLRRPFPIGSIREQKRDPSVAVW
jgi:hypothetical protein